ncbi:MbcA/ParS/Xre antitoxin family protein [Paraburkholderia aspalathi]|uniref:antitoxin Xre/MbcA/ParS toxin-binding domain-containing protein n=1 Tax=Paraburkholderia aspalathi TaxID=1324617 RepID=UPI0038BCCD12
MESNRINPANQGPTCDDDESAATIATLLAQVQSIAEQSGNPDGFDASSWLNRWLHTPTPALGSRPPIELLGTPEGVALVSSTIARMQSGAYM